MLDREKADRALASEWDFISESSQSGFWISHSTSNLGKKLFLLLRVHEGSLIHPRVEVLLRPMQGEEGLLRAKLSRCTKVSQFEDIAAVGDQFLHGYSNTFYSLTDHPGITMDIAIS